MISHLHANTMHSSLQLPDVCACDLAASPGAAPRFSVTCTGETVYAEDIRRVMYSPCLSTAGLCFLDHPVPAMGSVFLTVNSLPKLYNRDVAWRPTTGFPCSA